MTHEERIQRINELSRKSRAEGLTPEETDEQKVLRQEYIAVFRQNFRQQLDSIKFVDNNETGHVHDHNCGHDCNCQNHSHNHNHNHNHNKLKH